jgi:sucrose-6-phosphate hydrolase SacC (GH32 family)
MAIPRVLSLSDVGDLRQAPVSEIETLRETPDRLPDITLQKASRSLISGDCLDLQCEITAGAPAGLRVRGTEIRFTPRNGALKVGDVTGFAAVGKTVKLRVLLDRRVMEVYANDGAAAIFQTVDTWSGPLAVEAFADGEATITAIRSWRMKPATFDLSRF